MYFQKIFAWAGDDISRIAMGQLVLWSCFFYAFSASLPFIIAQTGWSANGLFYTLSISFFVWAGGSPIAGYIIDKGHGVPLIKIAIIFGAMVLFIISQAQSEYIVQICIVVLGIPMACVLYDPFFAIIMRQIPDKTRAGKAILKVTLIAGMATLFVYPLITFLAPIVGWRYVFMGLSVLVLSTLLYLPTGFLKSAVSPPPHTQTKKYVALIGYVPLIVSIGVCFGLLILAHTILIFQLPLYFISVQNAPYVSALLFLVGPAQVVGRWVLSLLTHKIATEYMGMIVCVLMVGAAVLIWRTHAHPVAVVIALLAQGMGWGGATVIRPVLIGKYFALTHVGKIVGTVAMIVLGFMAFSPTLGAVLFLQYGADIMFMVVIGFEIISLGVLVGLYISKPHIAKYPYEN